jgi:hypoxanthine phosphoribosyltransferase
MQIAVGDRFFETMLSHEEINERIAELAVQLQTDYAAKVPVFIGVLSGSFMFLGDLMKAVNIPAEVSFIKVASYQGDHSSGKIVEQLGFSSNLSSRDIILVEDIVDTGHTLLFLLEKIKEFHPKSVKVCSLLFKPAACNYQFDELQYIGFEIPNDFVLGYGLDYNGLGRNLKDIYRLSASKPNQKT